MTTDQLRERVAGLINPTAFEKDELGLWDWPGVSGENVRAISYAKADAILALLSPSPRGEEGGLAYVAPAKAPVSGSGLTPPAGWRLVPEEPTGEMVRAYLCYIYGSRRIPLSADLEQETSALRAAIAAAPPLPTTGPAGTGLDRTGEG